jgi:hypothetical protein
MLPTAGRSKGEIMRDVGCGIGKPVLRLQLGRIGLPGGIKVSLCGSNYAVTGVLSRVKALITRRIRQFLCPLMNFRLP